jgi:hypothetical protein
MVIKKISQVNPLYSECLLWLKCQDYQFNGVVLRIGLVPRSEMATLARLPSNALNIPLGLTKTSYMVCGSKKNNYKVDEIAILSGLDEEMFRYVLIHELGHAWLALNEIQGLPLWAEEGFCELLSYQYLKSCNTNKTIEVAEQIIMQTDQIYGDGFRAMRNFTYQYGINWLRDEMIKVKGLPSIFNNQKYK